MRREHEEEKKEERSHAFDGGDAAAMVVLLPHSRNLARNLDRKREQVARRKANAP